MDKGKIKLTFEVDRFKVIKMLAKNCESAEEYNEMMKIIESTDEIVREDASLEKTHCLLILDQLLHNNPNALLGVRLKKEEEEEEIPIPEENEEEEQKVIGAVKISGEEAKNFMDFVKKLVAKKKEGE
ncbi:hypothetical protein KSW92_08945 [Prevotella copri]|jgi:hypothetical protein|uniref:hypothetical protein n=1 Tax=Segatella copri TaxID=165179 RepID=UPI001C3840C7|nr:hypothetical protein [Segatella copri]MBV3429649.1 hypothetical protein [Segatella copri]